MIDPVENSRDLNSFCTRDEETRFLRAVAENEPLLRAEIAAKYPGVLGESKSSTTAWWWSWMHETTLWWKFVALVDELMHRVAGTGALRSSCKRLCDYYDRHFWGEDEVQGV